MSPKFIYKVVCHKDIEHELLMSIIALKDICWPHGLSSQIVWIDKYIYNDDLHLCVFVDGMIIGYCNLIKDIAIIDDKPYEFYGLGNLCVNPKYRHCGIATFLLEKCKTISDNSNMDCLLMCNNMTNYMFYKRRGCYSVPDYVEVFIDDQKKSAYLFSLSKAHIFINCKKIVFNRNF